MTILSFLAFLAFFAQDLPNIVVFIADDWSWHHAGVYGDTVVRTPNIDRLASEGVVFEHAYVSSPSCTPSRASLVTGQHFWRLGAGANLYGPLDPDHVSYVDLLEEAGYHVGFTGKGWSPGELGDRTRNPAGDRYESFAAFLEARPNGKPYVYLYGTTDPHRGYELGSGARAGIPVDQIVVPGIFPDTPEVRSDIADYYFEVERLDTDLGQLAAEIDEAGETENTLIVVTSDNGMPFPRAKGNLYDLGTRVPLIVRWPDRVVPARTVDDMVSLVDLAPTFLEIAGLPIPEAMSGKSLVPIIDASVVADDQEVRSHVFFGRERHTPAQASPFMGGYPMRAVRSEDFLYIYNFRPDLWPAGTPDETEAFVYGAWLSDCDDSPTKRATVNSEEHARLSFGKRPGEELYDLQRDPEQVNNLAMDPAYASQKRALWELLFTELQASGDPRALGYGEVFDMQSYTGGIVRR